MAILFAFIESAGSSSSELYTSEEESEEEYSENREQQSSEEIDFELREGNTPSPQRVLTGKDNELLSPLVAALGSTMRKKNGETGSQKEHVELPAQIRSSTEVTTTPLNIDHLHSKQKALTAGESKQENVDTLKSHQGTRQELSTNGAAKDHKHNLLLPHPASTGFKNTSSKITDTEHMKPAILHDDKLERFKASDVSGLSRQTQESVQPQPKVTSPVVHPQQNDGSTQPNKPSSKEAPTSNEKHQLATKPKAKIESKSKPGHSDTQEKTKVTGRFRIQNRKLSEGQPGVKKSSSPVKRFLPPMKLNFPSVSSRIKVFQKSSGPLVAARNPSYQEDKSLIGTKVEESDDQVFSERPQNQETQRVFKLEDLAHTDSESSIISSVSEITSPSTIMPAPRPAAIQSNSVVEPMEDFQFEKHTSPNNEHSIVNSTVTPNISPSVTAVENSSHKGYDSKMTESTVSPVSVSSPRFPLKGILKKKSRFNSSKSSDTDITTVTSLASDTSSNNSDNDVCQKPLVDTILKQSAPTQTQRSSESVLPKQTVGKMRLSVSESSTSSSDSDHDLDRTLTEELVNFKGTHDSSCTGVHNSGPQATISVSSTKRQTTSDNIILPQRNRANPTSDTEKSTPPQKHSSPPSTHFPANKLLDSSTSNIRVPSENSNLQLLSLEQLTHTDSETTLLSSDDETSPGPDSLPNRPMLMQSDMEPNNIKKARYLQ